MGIIMRSIREKPSREKAKIQRFAGSYLAEVGGGSGRGVRGKNEKSKVWVTGESKTWWGPWPWWL